MVLPSTAWGYALTYMHLYLFLISALINGAYEKCCILFNIGSLLSQIACSQNLSNDDGLKTAAKYFQQSSGIFSHLKDIAFPQMNTLPTPDLSVDCLATLSAIMLAQAQDCFYQKASAGKSSLPFYFTCPWLHSVRRYAVGAYPVGGLGARTPKMVKFPTANNCVKKLLA